MFKKFLFLGLIFGLIFGSPLSLAAPSAMRTPEVSGTIQIPNGLPAKEIQVQLMDNKGVIKQETKTDSKGFYALKSIERKKDRAYFVAIESPEYGRLKKPLDLTQIKQTLDFIFDFQGRVDFAYLFWPDGGKSLRDKSIDQGESALFIGNDSDQMGFRFDDFFVTGNVVSVANRHHKTVGRERAHFYVERASDGKLRIFAQKGGGIASLGSFDRRNGNTALPPKNDQRYKIDLPLKEDSLYGIYIPKIDRYALIYVQMITTPTPPKVLGEKSRNPRYYFLSGRVMTEDRRGISKTRLILKDQEGKTVAETATDDNGYYELSVELNKRNRYFLVIPHEHFADHIQSLSLKEKTQEINVIFYYPREINLSFRYNLEESSAFNPQVRHRLGFLKLFSDFEEGAYAGIDLATGQVTTRDESMVYVGMNQKGVMHLYVNDLGLGGFIDLGQTSSDFPIDRAPQSGYRSREIEAKPFHVYAIYDAKNRRYGFIRIGDIQEIIE